MILGIDDRRNKPGLTSFIFNIIWSITGFKSFGSFFSSFFVVT
jgi:hypothetical protein